MLNLITILFKEIAVKPLVRLRNSFYKYYDNDSLISEEGWILLNDPEKRIKLRKMIDNYHATGDWDFTILN